ncbi:hypothetical protein HK097_007821 [Rhizophlyctis rosea]|uniref:Vacuolar ATPase assembly integral membrane protein VMA21 n=1 Tax=Rhizophlyctis rosea TaxID=64517 RepID=A0AAD5X5P5_9FUNG|nr:hypothetical protein HK097_007821 [Rhizophlyctis rosea]
MTDVRKRAPKTAAKDDSPSVDASKDATSPVARAEKVTGAPAGRPVIPRFVVAKLLFFSFLLFALPLVTYYGTLNKVFNGNTNLSAISAVVVANVVVIAFVIVAFMENDDDLKREEKAKKGKSS